MNIHQLLFSVLVLSVLIPISQAQEIVFRYNQLGFEPDDPKSILVMSQKALRKKVHVYRTDSVKSPIKVKLEPVQGEMWGSYEHQYLIDLSDFTEPTSYFLKIASHQSQPFHIQTDPYSAHLSDLVAFMRQQRCGYNPYFDIVCHQGDGRIFYAPCPDSTYFDFSGGWHDAGDQLKYLITGSNATARMLMAYEMAPEYFADEVDALGHPVPNGIADILDEAKWGLDWILKLHPKSDWLIHQIADDRDHRGFKYPDKDPAEYGWGPNSYRAAYFANGEPQGLGKWKSKATGISNVAGRSAAALAIGARVWSAQGLDGSFAEKCKIAAQELYAMGQKQEGFQQGNSHGAPYRYNEDSWEDDMEWAAAELFRLTEEAHYLDEAIYYAQKIQNDGWMARDSMAHYEKYPFMNMGHYALFQVAPDSIKQVLSQWYQANIEKVLARAQQNAFEIGVPFLWCSNNLLVNFISQLKLWQEMTGNSQYTRELSLHRDWLFGRNPWGTSMFTGIPADGENPLDVHIPPRALLQDTPPGGLIDGPIYKSIHNLLLGLTLNEPDEFAAFQNDYVVYHDDIGDYSTNEPTMDGTADAIFMWALLVRKKP